MNTIKILTFFCVMVFVSCSNSIHDAMSSGDDPDTAPAALVLTASNSRITAHWNSYQSAISYEVWYKISEDNTAAALFESDPDTTDTTCIITGLINNTEYSVCIRAITAGGKSNFSKTANGTPSAPAPSGLKVETVSASSLKISWNEFEGATAYRLYCADAPDGTYSKVGTDITDTQYTHAGLFSAITKYYKISAINSEGESDLSEFVSAATIKAPGMLNASFASNFTAGSNSWIGAIGFQTDGKILVAGLYWPLTGQYGIERLDANGLIDTGFNASGNGASSTLWPQQGWPMVSAIAIQNDGKIIIGGLFTLYNAESRQYIARLNTDGTLDTTFNSSGTMLDKPVYSVIVDANNKILIGGDFTTCNGAARKGIARLNSDGTLDTTFNPGTGITGSTSDDGLTTIALQDDEKIIIAGRFTAYNETARNNIARITSTGSIDTQFNPGSGASFDVNGAIVLSDGKILINGRFSTYNGTARKYIARLNTDGSLASSFDPGTSTGDDEIYAMAVQKSGKIIIGGGFSSYRGIPRQRLARLNPDGSLDTSFSPGTSGVDRTISTIETRGTEDIYIGGYFESCDGVARRCIAKIFGN